MTPKPYVPQHHHELGIQFLVERAVAGLFLDPSMGKTGIVLAALSLLRSERVAGSALVLAPLRVAHSVWPGESRKWQDFNGMRVTVLHGPDKAYRLRQPADVYVMNYEGLPWLYDELVNWEGDWPFDVLVLDESSKVRNTQTQRFKLLRPMINNFRRRYILTGSPAPKSLLNLYGQMYMLDGGATLGGYFTRFRERYFVPPKKQNGDYTWRLRKGADEEIYDAIAPLVLRLAADDYLQLPDVITNDVEILLPKKAMREYVSMENMLRMQVESGAITAKNVGVAVGKCRQITSGAVYDDMRQWHAIHDAKVDAVIDLVDEIEGRGVMVLYEYQHELERIQARMKKEYGETFPVLSSKNSPAKNLQIEADWNAGRIPILFGHPAAMGHGLNLQDAGYAQIWTSTTWDYELYDQTVRRLRRVNRAQPVIVHRLVVPGTVDEDVIKTLEMNERGQQALFDALKKRWKGKRK